MNKQYDKLKIRKKKNKEMVNMMISSSKKRSIEDRLRRDEIWRVLSLSEDKTRRPGEEIEQNIEDLLFKRENTSHWRRR